MVVLLLSTVTQDGSCGGDEEGRRWCPCMFLVVAYVFFSVSALLPSLCLCYFLFLFRTVFAPLMVVLLLSTVTQGDSSGGHEEGRRWCPYFFPCLPLFCFPTLLSVFQIKFFFTSFFPTLLVCLFSLHIVTCMFFLVQIAINF